MVSGMMRIFFAFLFIGIGGIGALGQTVWAISELRDPEPCRTERDQRLRALDDERISIETIIDNDASVSGAASYHLEEARKALIAEIERQRASVEAEYQRCLVAVPATQ